MLTATAAEIVDTDQPYSARSGSMSTPGTARNAAAPTSARKVTAATHQAGWIRAVRVVTTAEHGRRRPAADSGPTAADAGFGTPASLRSHLRASIGVAPAAYRRTYRGGV